MQQQYDEKTNTREAGKFAPVEATAAQNAIMTIKILAVAGLIGAGFWIFGLIVR